jgi:hypothetical protein
MHIILVAIPQFILKDTIQMHNAKTKQVVRSNWVAIAESVFGTFPSHVEPTDSPRQNTRGIGLTKQWIPVQPPSQPRAVVPEPVVVEFDLLFAVLG